jgi:YesN/AraC family two-component response regulator
MGYHLLIVDDDEDFREVLCGCFDSYEITQAHDGETALAILKKPNTIDLVLLDVMMPGLSGTDVLAEMKKQKPDMKIVIITGSDSKDVVIEALKNRADEFIEKPFDAAETREIVAKLLSEKDWQDIPDTGNLEARLEKKVSLNDAAAHAGLSAKYLSRVFEEKTGMGFADFKSAVKVKKARELLKQGYNINQISDRLAYSGADSFIHAFKQATGFTPALYRDKKIVKKSKSPVKRKPEKTGRCRRKSRG